MNSIQGHIRYSRPPKKPACPPCVWHKSVSRLPKSGRRVTVSRIISYVARAANFYPEDLRGVRKFNRLCRVRWTVIWLCRELTDASYPQIGQAMRRDHTTILHGYRRALEIRDKFPHQRREMDRLCKELAEEFMV